MLSFQDRVLDPLTRLDKVGQSDNPSLIRDASWFSVLSRDVCPYERVVCLPVLVVECVSST